ncbi:CC0125/CC1285 family lipoprotein [Parvularcula dongshanensis]|uniref:Uncharacterized protein n=1 Tax=Parvularcula dongshanensis TaxID=1173995 RepID=A0A840I5M6_9PROT|nr:hypothetical protein [Parvularcula dongshanensis]MBB4659702.1 hypothetical protein [Parvularcula dongshanensis]
MRWFTTATIVIALSACATGNQNAYREADRAGGAGYSSTQIGDQDRFEIAYVGTPKMPQDVVARYALRRAAELTIEQGGEWFAVLNTNTRMFERGKGGDLRARTGPFLNDEGASDSRTADSSSDIGDTPDVMTGQDFGGFGGSGVPYQVQERWRRPTFYQTRLIIQTGSGDEASFPGVTSPPQIFSARTIIEAVEAQNEGE